MPSLKVILAQQAGIPANLEASIPLIPKVSGILTQLALAVPDIQLPDLPIGAAGGLPGAGVGVSQIVRGFEDAIPIPGLPKVSDAIQAVSVGGFRPVETPTEKPANSPKRVLGSGYRSI